MCESCVSFFFVCFDQTFKFFLCSTCAKFVACALLPKEEESMLSVWRGVAKVQLFSRLQKR